MGAWACSAPRKTASRNRLTHSLYYPLYYSLQTWRPSNDFEENGLLIG
jgi:hypothetical protein